MFLHLYKFLMNSYILKGIYIELLESCNLNCIHCYNNSGADRNRLSLEKIIEIVDEAEKNNISTISLSGGEPLLYSELFLLLKYIQENTHLKTTIVTNGTLLSEMLVSKVLSVIDINRIMFQVSIDGATSFTHDYIRGHGSFDKLMSGIKVLEKHGIFFYFHVVLNKTNINDVRELVDLAIRYNHSTIDFSMLKSKGRALDNNNDLLIEPEKLISVIHELNSIKKEKNNQIKINSPSIFYGECPLWANDDNITLSIRISASGNVYPCQLFSCDSSVIGNIYDQSIDSMICNIQNISRKDKQQNKCRNCIVKNICKGGCPGVEWHEDLISDINKYSDDCKLRICNFKKIIKELKT